MNIMKNVSDGISPPRRLARKDGRLARSSPRARLGRTLGEPRGEDQAVPRGCDFNSARLDHVSVPRARAAFRRDLVLRPFAYGGTLVLVGSWQDSCPGAAPWGGSETTWNLGLKTFQRLARLNKKIEDAQVALTRMGKLAVVLGGLSADYPS